MDDTRHVGSLFHIVNLCMHLAVGGGGATRGQGSTAALSNCV